MGRPTIECERSAAGKSGGWRCHPGVGVVMYCWGMTGDLQQLRSHDLLGVLLSLALLVPVVAQNPDQARFFEAEIRPLLAAHCIKCHGPEKQRSGLRLDHGSFVLKGGVRGPAVVPGDTTNSRLLHALHYGDLALQMPPQGKLPNEAIEKITKWIKDGAYWPDEPPPEAGAAESAFDLEQRRSAHWCWQPIANPQVPRSGGEWPRDDVDRFLHRALREHDLEPAPDVDPATWLRRVTFALTGLPPTLEQQRGLHGGLSKAEREQVVDDLLASPRFGEHMARKWMDLVRYAESYGHEFDYSIPEAWRYRDYLIRAFNGDVAYGRFVQEHIAGDLLVTPRVDSETACDQSVMGTGFWWLDQATHGPTDVRDDEANRFANQIDVASKTFLGLTVACARCHDHKFDAISAQDFYAWQGMLQSSRRTLAYVDPGGAIERSLEARERDRLAWESRQPEHGTLRPVEDRAAALGEARRRYRARPQLVNLEGEALKIIAVSGGNTRPQDLRGWSGGRHLWWTGGQIGSTIDLEVPIPRPGSYELNLDLTTAHDYGIVAVTWDGEVLEKGLNLFTRQVRKLPVGPYKVTCGEGSMTLRFQITGKDKKAAPGFMVGLDCVRLREVPVTDPAETSLAIDSYVAALSSFLDSEIEGHPLSGWSRRVRGATRSSMKPGKNADASYRATFKEDANSWSFEGAGIRHIGWLDEASEVLLTKADEPVRWVTPGCLHSGLAGPEFRGTARSPTFVLNGSRIQYRIRARDVRVKLVIDGYFMDVYNGLLFGGVTKTVNTGGRWKWVEQTGDLANYQGHRAWIEVEDLGDGYFVLDEVRVTDEPLGRTEATDLKLEKEADWEDWEEILALTIGDELRDSSLAARATTWPLATEVGDRPSPGAVLPDPIRVLAMTEGTPENEYIFIRGTHKNQGADAPRGGLTAFGGASTGDDCSGRLAWVQSWTESKNPLFARVIVNRLWQQMFGQGIVPTPDDFGVLGQPPTHPELLDHLAHWFRTDGNWSIKKALKRLALTRAFAMSTQPVDEVATSKRDATRSLLSAFRLRRLSGEEIRDALLAVSRRLDAQMYGPSVPVHLTPFMTGRGRPGRSGPADGSGRRSVYLEVRRNFLSPFMLAFDTPQPFTTAGRRSISNVPQQSLALLNDPVVADLARSCAQYLIKAHGDDRSRIDHTYRLLFCRKPTADEVTSLQAYLRDQGDQGWEHLIHVLFNSKEWIFIS